MTKPMSADEMCAVIDRGMAEIDRLRAKNNRMHSALLECETYFDERCDVIDGSYGEPAPNREMNLLTEVRNALGKGDRP